MAVIDWLLDSDPAIRWQAMRDLLDAPEAEWRAERAKVETEGWGARLLSFQDEDGQWAGGSFVPRGFDPRSGGVGPALDGHDLRADAAARARARSRLRTRRGGPPSWSASSRAGITTASRSGRARSRSASTAGPSPPAPTSGSTSRRSSSGWWGRRWQDGGWNCVRANGSTRSSFHRPSTCWKGSWSTSAPPAARPRPARRALGRGVSAGAPPVPPAQHRRAGRRAPPPLHPPEPLVLRRPPRARPLPRRRRRRPPARRGDRPRPLAPVGRRHLAARLDAARPGLVRHGRRPRASPRAGSPCARCACSAGGSPRPPGENIAVMEHGAWDRVPIDAQSVEAPLSRAAVFLVLAAGEGDADLAACATCSGRSATSSRTSASATWTGGCRASWASARRCGTGCRRAGGRRTCARSRAIHGRRTPRPRRPATCSSTSAPSART